MTVPLVIIGCGGFGRETYAMVQALNRAGADWFVEGFADDSPSPDDCARVAALGCSVLGTVDVLATRTARFAAVIAVGSPSARARIAVRLASAPVDYPRLVHPTATLGPLVHLAEGAVIAPGARLSTNISVGRHVHVDQNVTVGHDSRIEDLARLNPQACISGSVVIERRALIGAAAVVLPGLTVGTDAVVGAAACVVADVPAGAVVKGVPAR